MRIVRLARYRLTPIAQRDRAARRLIFDRNVERNRPRRARTRAGVRRPGPCVPRSERAVGVRRRVRLWLKLNGGAIEFLAGPPIRDKYLYRAAEVRAVDRDGRDDDALPLVALAHIRGRYCARGVGKVVELSADGASGP